LAGATSALPVSRSEAVGVGPDPLGGTGPASPGCRSPLVLSWGSRPSWLLRAAVVPPSSSWRAIDRLTTLIPVTPRRQSARRRPLRRLCSWTSNYLPPWLAGLCWGPCRRRYHPQFGAFPAVFWQR